MLSADDPLPRAPRRPAFLDDVRELTERESWTTEWQYSPARALLAERADLLAARAARAGVHRGVRHPSSRAALGRGDRKRFPAR